MKKLKLRQIEVISAIFRTGSITEAARELNVSQPAISKTLKQAEKELGINLFTRSRSGISLTPEAELLQASIQGIDSALNQFNDTALDVTNSRTGHLKLIAPPAIGNGVVPQALEVFRKEFPFMPIHLSIEKMRKINKAINYRQADIGIVHFPSENSEVLAKEIKTCNLACVMHKTHPLAKQQVITGEDLRDHAIVFCNDESWLAKIMEDLVDKYAIPPRNHVWVNQFLPAFNLASRGLGVTLIDEFTLLDNKVDRSQVAIRPFQPTIEVVVGVLYRRYSPLSKPAERFIEILRDSFTRKYY